MIQLLLIAITITELIKYGIWFLKIKEMKLKDISQSKVSYVFAGGIIGIYLLLIITGIINEDTLQFLWNIISIVVYVTILYGNKGEKVLAMLQAYIIVPCVEEVIFIFQNMFVSVSAFEETQNKFVFLVNYIISIIILWIIAYISKRIRNGVRWQNKKGTQWLIYAAGFFLVLMIRFTVSGTYVIGWKVGNLRARIFVGMISAISYIGIIFFITLLSYVHNERNRTKMFLEKEIQLVEMQRNMYDAMLSKNEETRRFRHDSRKHLMCLKELANQGEMERVQNYIDSMEGDILTIQERTYSVGNNVMDAVLNYYLPMLEGNVKISIDGFCAPEVAMSEMEFCTVVSNLIQNAVEALNNTVNENNYLKVKFIRREDNLRIIIKNSICGENIVLNENQMPTTTKKDREEHGIGLRNAKDVVEKNGGIFRTEIEQNEFVVSVEVSI